MFRRLRQLIVSISIRSQYKSFVEEFSEMKERALERRATRDIDELKKKAEKVIHRFQSQPNLPEYKLACWVFSECQGTIDAIESGSHPTTYKREFIQGLDRNIVHV